ncbi:hypothetical protein D3C76_814030 [compost metagenome]
MFKLLALPKLFPIIPPVLSPVPLIEPCTLILSTILPDSAFPIIPVLVLPTILVFSNTIFFISEPDFIIPNNPVFIDPALIYKLFILCPAPSNEPENPNVVFPIGTNPAPV